MSLTRFKRPSLKEKHLAEELKAKVESKNEVVKKKVTKKKVTKKK